MCVTKKKTERAFVRKNYVREIITLKKCFNHRNQFWSQKQVLSELPEEKHISVAEKSFCHRKKFLSQKKVSVSDTKNMSEKKYSVTEAIFCHKKRFCHRNKFPSQKQVLSSSLSSLIKGASKSFFSSQYCSMNKAHKLG